MPLPDSIAELVARYAENRSEYRIRRYGWTAKLPLSILTNFEEFAIYDLYGLTPEEISVVEGAA